MPQSYKLSACYSECQAIARMIILHPYRFCGRSWLAFFALSCMMTTLKGGYQARSSLSHCRITVAGHTMMLGLNKPLRCKPARKAASWMVLPKPISSPMMPPALCVCSSHSHFTPGGKATTHMGKPGLLASCFFSTASHSLLPHQSMCEAMRQQELDDFCLGYAAQAAS